MQATTTTSSIAITEGGNTELSKLLTKILNASYTSGVDRIKTYGKTPGGNIVGEFIADGTSFQYLLNLKTNTVSYEVVGSKSASKMDSLLAEKENTDRFKAIYSVREAFEISEANAIEQKLDSWFSRADAPTKAKVGIKTAANKSGKTLTCTPGKTFPCGAVCRAMGKPCKQPMSPEVQEIAKQVAAKIKTPTATTTSATPTTAIAPTAGIPSGKITAQKMAEQIAAAKALEPQNNKKITSFNKLQSKIINIRRIDPPAEEFDADDLRAAAESLLEIGGFVEPPIVRRTGTPLEQKYEVVSGQFQVAAAIVARAIDPLKGESFPVMIIEEENEEAIVKQMKAVKNANKNQQSLTKKETTKSQSVESYDDFKKTALNTYDKLNKDYNLDNLVPIYRIRREIGEKVSRSDFNQYLGKMQAEGTLMLQGGEMTDITPDKAEDSYQTSLGELRYYATKLRNK